MCDFLWGGGLLEVSLRGMGGLALSRDLNVFATVSVLIVPNQTSVREGCLSTVSGPRGGARELQQGGGGGVGSH